MSGFGIFSPIKPRLGCVMGIVTGLIGNHVNLNFPVTSNISGYRDHQTGLLNAMSDQHAHEPGSLDAVSLENPGRAEIHSSCKKGNPTRSESRQMSVGYRSIPGLARPADITDLKFSLIFYIFYLILTVKRDISISNLSIKVPAT